MHPEAEGSVKQNGISDAMALIRNTYFATEYLCVDSENESSSQVVDSYHICFQFISWFGGWLKMDISAHAHSKSMVFKVCCLGCFTT